MLPAGLLAAQVYQFTLYDINARGFVRPVCISFISSDPDKIMPHFEDLTREFNKVFACAQPAKVHSTPPLTCCGAFPSA